MVGFQSARKAVLMAGAVAIAPFVAPALSEDDNGLTALEEVVVVGSRRQQARSVAESPVPVDVIPEEQFSQGGNRADSTDHLLSTVPSFNATPASGDSASFSRPVSLRGLAQDQILLMVNGKRRHRSSVITDFAPAAGLGAQGPNIGMIPAIAIESVEVLRDGASAQYGADAIAGVINFRLKEDAEGGETRLQYGQFFEGEVSVRLETNVGIPLSERAFANLSLDYSDNDGLSRGFQRPDAQRLVDAGVQGVGADSPFGDGLAQSWGRPESRNILLFLNSGYQVSENMEAYVFGNYASTNGRFRFFYRPGDNPSTPDPDDFEGHRSVEWLREQGYEGSILQTGYTPYLDGQQQDYSLVGGLKGRLPSGFTYDLSGAIGVNELQHYLHNAVSYNVVPSADDVGKRSFYVGLFRQEELNLSADLTKQLTERLHLGFGGEWREESWTLGAGEPDSYERRSGADSLGTGPSGMQGFHRDNAGTWSRDNVAVYAELEHEVTDRLLMQYAARYEEYSDFGDVFIGKGAAHLAVTESAFIRGSVSSGFHAPTPGQSNFNRTTTTFGCKDAQDLAKTEGFVFDTTDECNFLDVPPTSELAMGAGGLPLKEEESINYTVGAGFSFGALGTLTVDMYRIEVEDRIYKVAAGGRFENPDRFQSPRFFSNVLDVRSSGIDLVLSRRVHWNNNVRSNLTFAYNYNDFEVIGQDLVDGRELISERDEARIENSYPKHRLVAAVNTEVGNWDFLVRANYFGEHYDVDQGSIPEGTSPPIDPVVFVDVEFGYNLNESLKIVAGAANIFDEYVDLVDREDYPETNRYGNGLLYPRRAASNYEGGSWYLQARYTF